MSTYHCEDCGWSGSIDDMDRLDDIHERVLPGELMAAGQCPECGSLIGISDDDVPDYTIRDCLKLAAKRGITL